MSNNSRDAGFLSRFYSKGKHRGISTPRYYEVCVNFGIGFNEEQGIKIQWYNQLPSSLISIKPYVTGIAMEKKPINSNRPKLI